MILLDGFRVGHWTDPEAGTGCTVLLCPPSTVASCEVRGASPGSRELALLAPDKKMNSIDALVFTGGSAFGLASADGVVRWLEENGKGYETPWGRVPIVPAAVIFDLNLGSWNVRPTAQSGYEACAAASEDTGPIGNIGAGYGATVGKWRGMRSRMKGGVGTSEGTYGDVIVQALVVVNAVGDVIDRNGAVLAGARDADGSFFADKEGARRPDASQMRHMTNTTLAAVLTNASLHKRDCFRVAQRMHDGFARSIAPVHTSYDGDVSFALSSGKIPADIDLVAELAADATSDAIRQAVRSAESAFDVPGSSE